YDGGPFEIQGSGDVVRFHPIALPHDSQPTFAFRIEALRSVPPRSMEATAELYAQAEQSWVKLGYLADLGRLSDDIAEAVADVDLLALEFNHDEDLERKSGRHPRLIGRVMGGNGH